MLELSLYPQLLGLSQGVLVDGVTAVLELHTPQARAGAGCHFFGAALEMTLLRSWI